MKSKNLNSNEIFLWFLIIWPIFMTILLWFFLPFGGALVLVSIFICGFCGYCWIELSKEKKKRKLEEARRKHREWLQEETRKQKEDFEHSQKEKGLVKFVSYDRIEKWGTQSQIEEWGEVDFGLSNNFADYSPFEFEEFIAQLFQKMDFHVELTRPVKDYGVDVVARKGSDTIAIQVKKYAIGNNVGAKEVQQILGAMWKVKANQSIIVTTSGFTLHAREQAKEAPVELWGRRTLHEMVRKYFIDID